jgi:AraC-like DNA-binding protein
MVVHRLARSVLDEVCAYGDLTRPEELRRLLACASFGLAGAMIREQFRLQVDPVVRGEVTVILDATLLAIAYGEISVLGVARRLHVSRSTLGRHLARAGLVAPSVLLHRTRLILAPLLRTEPVGRGEVWKRLGFHSPGHLSTRFRAHFGQTLGDLDRWDRSTWLPELIGALIAGGDESGR